MTGDPLLLMLVTLAAILATEALAFLGRSVERLIPRPAVFVVLPVAVRMAFFALATVKLSTGLVQIQHALALLNSIAQ
jgi:hypothetical protein